MLKRDAGVAVVVAQEKLAQELPGSGAPVVSVDGEWEAIERQPESNAAGAEWDGGNLAYVHVHVGLDGQAQGSGGAAPGR